MKQYTIILRLNQHIFYQFVLNLNILFYIIGLCIIILGVFSVFTIHSTKIQFNKEQSQFLNLKTLAKIYHTDQSLRFEHLDYFINQIYPISNLRYSYDKSSQTTVKSIYLWMTILEELNLAYTAYKNLNQDMPFGFPTVGSHVVNSNFGIRRDPLTGKLAFHSGIDIFRLQGVPILSSGNGIIIQNIYSNSYGHFIEIQHPYGFSSSYAHMKTRGLLHVGETVQKNQIIGYVGNTGRSVGSHLHYELKFQENYLNPINYIFLDENL